MTSKRNHSEAVLSLVRGNSKHNCFLITEEGNFRNHKITGCDSPTAYIRWNLGHVTRCVKTSLDVMGGCVSRTAA